jgi:hypothetical protein
MSLPTSPTAQSPLRGDRASSRDAWKAVALSWLAARLIVLPSFTLARYLHRTAHMTRHFEGLVGWDADWYRRIATAGYDGVPHEGLRFFPLFPLLARTVGYLPGISVGAATVILANVASLAYAYLLYRLALREGFSPAAAGRSVWVLALVPAGFVLVMGYAEALAGILAVSTALLVRSGRWWPAVLPAALLGALRPTGVVICVFLAVEALRALRGASVQAVAARLCVLIAPVVGLASYLSWCAARFGDALLPFTVQTDERLRGGALVSPVPAARTALHGLLSGTVPTQAPHLGWILITIGLAVACSRFLPASYTTLAVVMIVLGATARDFQSYERYAASAFPLLLAAGRLPLDRSIRSTVAVAAGALLAMYTVVAALHRYVP